MNQMKQTPFTRRTLFAAGAGLAAASAIAPYASAHHSRFYAKRFKGRKAPKLVVQGFVVPPKGGQAALNKPVLIKFMATWCPVCRQWWQPLSRIQEELRDEITVVGICFQDKGKVAGWAQTKRLKYALAYDTKNRLYDAYKLQNTFPHFVYIDSRGIVRMEGIRDFNKEEKFTKELRSLARRYG